MFGGVDSLPDLQNEHRSVVNMFSQKVEQVAYYLIYLHHFIRTRHWGRTIWRPMFPLKTIPPEFLAS